jgi:regulator of RNase E activity RraA
VDLHRTVRVGGLTIHPGDLIHADCNGVAIIPLDIAAEVAQVAAEFVAAEGLVLDYLKSGTPGAAAFAEARKAMMERLAVLGERVRSTASL